MSLDKLIATGKCCERVLRPDRSGGGNEDREGSCEGTGGHSRLERRRKFGQYRMEGKKALLSAGVRTD